MSALEEPYEIEMDEVPRIDPSDIAEALSNANWHLRCIGVLTSQQERTAALYVAEIEALQARMRAVLDKGNRKIAWHEEVLHAFMPALLERDPSFRTIELPHGDLLATVPVKPKVEITNPDAVVLWAESEGRDELLKREAKPIHAAIKKASDDGEVIPGVTRYLPDPKFNYHARSTSLVES